MKILCVSDSHLENNILKNITDYYDKMDYYIHCGDSSLLKEDILLEKYYVVAGNHDYEEFPQDIILQIGSYNCLITHGHLYKVYYGYDQLLDYMDRKNIDICFHGHTHVPTYYKQHNKIIINPGSAMINRASYGFGSYAVISLEETIKVQFFHHTTHVECTKQVLEDGKKTLQEFQELLKNRV